MFPAPRILKADVFARLPDSLAFGKRESSWAKAVLGRDHVHSFLEGPSFDREGNLWVVDIPWGRLLRIDPDGNFEVAFSYDGEPNGLKFHADGTAFIADHRLGLLRFMPGEQRLEKVQPGSFHGLNDLHFGPDGTLWFTDQGHSGLHDPFGRVFVRGADGAMHRLLGGIPSPNGLVLDAKGENLLLAVTRDNAIWRVPLRPDHQVGRVGRFIQLSGGIGPDGLALDAAGNLAVCHPGLGCVWLFSPAGEPLLRIDSPAGRLTTNCAFGGADGRTLFITESETGTILRADLPEPGALMFARMGLTGEGLRNG